ncbi:MAG: riboflavin synthase, partial [Chitinophagales bacterium]
MFTGIIEELGEVIELENKGTNLNLSISTVLSSKLKIDQSVSHNGVCLTVVEKSEKSYTVNIIEESLNKSNLGKLKVGDKVNLERAARMDSRLDGHMVQGHVDQTGTCLSIEENDGSWLCRFEFLPNEQALIVDKGSICINGVSLTVVQCKENWFEVAIIPYTYEHTNFHLLKPGSLVNLEFDIIGKYLLKYAKPY